MFNTVGAFGAMQRAVGTIHGLPAAGDGCLHFDCLEQRRLLAAGALDPSFGAGGRVVGGAQLDWVGISQPLSADVVVDSAGRTVLAGTATLDDTRTVIFVARFDRDGGLDDSFSKDGLVLIDFGGPGNDAAAVAIDSAGRIVVAGSIQGARREQFGFARLKTDGTIDGAFSTDGLFLIDFGADAQLNDIAIDGGNRIFAAGSIETGVGGSSVATARVNPSGKLDSSYDNDGKKLVDASSGHDSAEAIAFAGDRIYLAGTTTDGTANFAAMRLRTNGSLDRSFDGNGISAVDFNGQEDDATAILIDSAGRVVLAGFAGFATAVARLTSSGAVDGSFSDNGRADHDELFPDRSLLSLYRGERAAGLEGRPQLLADGSGYRLFSGNADSRLTNAGVPDEAFGIGGIRAITSEDFLSGSPPHAPLVRSVVADGTGIAAARNLDRDSGHQVPIPFFFGTLVDRVAANGTISDDDRHQFIPVSDLASTVVGADGRFFVSGSFGKGSVIQAYRADGHIDTSFGGRGFIFDENPRNEDGSWDVFAQGDGTLLTRYSGTENSDNDPIAIVLQRLRANGTFDPAFDDFNSADESVLRSLTLLPRNSLTFEYRTTAASQNPFWLKRENEEAVLVRLPMADLSNDDEGADGAAAIAGSSSIYATGHFREGDPVSVLKRALVRLNPNGSLDTTFADQGIVRDFTGTILWGQANNKVLFTLPGQSGLRRLNSDGTPDTAFGSNGVAAAGFTNFDIDSQGRIVAFREIRSGVSDGDVQVMRLTINGKIDSTFGGGDGLTAVDTRVSSAATPNLLISPADDIVVTSYETAGTNVKWSATRLLGA